MHCCATCASRPRSVYMRAVRLKTNYARCLWMMPTRMRYTRSSGRGGTYDPAYLNYTLSKLMIMKLRRTGLPRAAAAWHRSPSETGF